MEPLSIDTTQEAQDMLFELTRRAPVWKRLKLTCDFVQMTRMLMLADLRSRFPEATEAELRRRLIARILTRAEVLSVYGFDPVEEGY